jgi:hypothetical protein
MTQNRLLTSILFILIYLFLPGCALNSQELKNGWWKYGEGYHIGDVVDFNKSFEIKGDTILQRGHRVGVITRKTKGIFGADNEIEITSLDNKQPGVYH